MTRLFFILLTTNLILAGCTSKGETEKDSVTYWVNDKYIACLDSGKSVCHCQEQNNFLILHVDTIKNKLTVDPSVYISMETFEFNIKYDKKNIFSIRPTYGIDSGSVFKINGDQLALTSPKKVTLFTKIEVKLIDNSIHGDLWRQIGVINCRPLLKYNLTSCKGTSNLILTHKELSNYIQHGQISISCSDDLHYNEMNIKDSNSEFFLVYGLDSIIIYKIPIRDRGIEVDMSKLKICQLFYLKKK